MADRLDQIAFLTLAGISHNRKNNNIGGSSATRPVLGSGANLSDLAFNGDVTAPTSNRHRRVDATNGLVAGDTSASILFWTQCLKQDYC